MRLDLGCGERTPEGWLGVDISPLVRPAFVHDLRDPWPLEWRGAVEEARCSHFLEHLFPHERHHLMNELWLALVDGGECEFTTPIGQWRAMQDPDHKWPPVVPGSYSYYSRAWLRANKLEHYRARFGIRCDFQLVEAPKVHLVADQWANDDARRDELMLWHPDAQTDLVVRLRKVGG